jgi:8-oxo-dGTP pyrophosphatase MutT (NUDIX family)
MYKVFVNDRPIILTNKIEKENDFKLFMLDTVNINDVVQQLNTKEIKAAYLYHPNKEQLLSKFRKKLPSVVAAGGRVTNSKGKILFIHRNSKWDLPKGKVDKGESVEEAAIREVEEETGVTGLTITKFIKITYHIFKRNGKLKLKETHWFDMQTNFSGKLKPQLEEDIDRVEWFGKKKTQKALEKSYANIKTLF